MAPHTHTAPSLLPLDVQRAIRGIMSDAELVKLCASAARLEMRGANYSPEDRADAAAQLAADVLAECHGSPPRATDRHYSLTALCGRARNLRRSLDRQRQRDAAEAAQRADAELWTVAPLASLADVLAADALTPDEGAAIAARVCARLDLDDVANAADLIARLVRGVTGETVAAERDCAPATIRQRERRAAQTIRQRYPNAAALIAAVADVVTPDQSREARGHGETVGGAMLRAAANDWRTGTANGAAPTRPDTAEQARALCAMRKARGRRKHRETPAAEQSASLARLGAALARERTDGQRERSAAARAARAETRPDRAPRGAGIEVAR